MKLVSLSKKISLKELKNLAEKGFGNLVKAVVDIEKKVMAAGGELHADEEAYLLKKGSKQENLWGINFYPQLYPDSDWLEFDSVINLRPSLGNNSRGIDSIKVRKKVVQTTNDLIEKK